MRTNKLFFMGLLSLLVGCSGQKKEALEFSEDTTTIPTPSTKDYRQKDLDRIRYYDSIRDNLKFEITDTLKISKPFYFSNRETEDNFLLTVFPGLINKSKSEFKIVTDQGKVIYTQVFDSYNSFVSGILQPPKVPPGGQEAYDRYRNEYLKSLTLNQYDSYVNKKFANFFDRIHFIERDRLEDYLIWGDPKKDVLNEVQSDTTIILLNISCFDCNEGGEVVFFSKDKKELKTLLIHD